MILLPAMLFASGGKEEKSATAPSPNTVKVAQDWGFSWEFSKDEIEFTVTAPTSGWVGIGFNPSYMMKDAHYILGYVKDSTLFIQDNYGTGNTSHASDVSLGGTADVRGLRGSEKDGITTIVFALPLDSKDKYDKKFVQGDTYTVLLAYGRDDADDFTSMHAKRVAVETVLK
jgi:hypothetical protein